ncbi:MAG: hypothetical protein Q8L07_09040 [Sediminibacterium sp.]|nr:hypothetical protein [Sediminibacterium sp.]
MKKKLSLFTAFLFAATLLLNLSFDSNGNFRLFNSATAKVLLLPDYKGPSTWYCYTNGEITSTSLVCTDEGSISCSPTACP